MDDTRPAAEYVPAFSGWRRRIDPSLTAEDANAVFQAFRERRRHARARLPVRWWVRRRGPGILAFLWILVWTLLFVGLFRQVGWMGYITLVVLGVVVWYFIPARGGLNFAVTPLDSILGTKVADIFRERSPNRQAVMDLWLTGANGRTFLEACYLERLETYRPAGVVVFMSVCAAVNVVCFARIESLFRFPSLLFCLLNGLVFWMTTRVFLYNASGRVRVEVLLPTFREWTRASGGFVFYRWGDGLSLRRALWNLFNLCSAPILIGYVLYQMMLLASGILLPSLFPKFLREMGCGLPFAWVSVLVMALIAIPAVVHAGTMKQRNLRRLYQLLDNANTHFQEYFALHIVRDGKP